MHFNLDRATDLFLAAKIKAKLMPRMQISYISPPLRGGPFFTAVSTKVVQQKCIRLRDKPIGITDSKR